MKYSKFLTHYLKKGIAVMLGLDTEHRQKKMVAKFEGKNFKAVCPVCKFWLDKWKNAGAVAEDDNIPLLAECSNCGKITDEENILIWEEIRELREWNCEVEDFKSADEMDDEDTDIVGIDEDTLEQLEDVERIDNDEI